MTRLTNQQTGMTKETDRPMADEQTKQERVSYPAAIDDDEVEREVHPALQAAIDHTRANIAAAFSARSKVNTAMRPHPDERVEVLVKAARDALSGWTYIRMFHGDLPGVGWDRVEQSLRTALASVSTKTGGV